MKFKDASLNYYYIAFLLCNDDKKVLGISAQYK